MKSNVLKFILALIIITIPATVVFAATAPDPQTVEAYDCEAGIWIVLNSVGKPLPTPMIRSIKKYNPLEIQPQSVGKVKVLSICFRPYTQVRKYHIEFDLKPPSTTTTTTGSTTTTTSGSGSTTTTTIQIEPGTVVDFGGSHINGASSKYKVKVNGQPVHVHFFKTGSAADDGRLHYVHFGFSGSTEIEVENIAGNIDLSQTQISPLRWKIQPVANGKKMTFTLNEPKKLMLFINKNQDPNHFKLKHSLVIFAEEMETDVPDKNGPKTVVVNNAGEAQSKINNCPTGGTIYFPRGTYQISSPLKITKSDITIYLEPGTFIKCNCAYVLQANNLKNVNIKGRGVIQSSGQVFHPKNIDNLNVEGVIFRNGVLGALGWAVKPGKTSNSMFKNVKIMQPPFMKVPRVEDGLDPSNSQNLVIDDCFVYSGDDAIAVKTFGCCPEPGNNGYCYSHTCGHTYSDGDVIEIKNLVINNTVLFTVEACAIKTGSEIFRPVNMVWENIDAIHGQVILTSRAQSSGNTGMNIKMKNIHVENSRGRIFELGWLYGSNAMYVHGPINIQVEDMTVHAGNAFRIYAAGDTSGQIVFKNLNVKGKHIKSLSDLNSKGIGTSINKPGALDIRFE